MAPCRSPHHNCSVPMLMKVDVCMWSGVFGERGCWGQTCNLLYSLAVRVPFPGSGWRAGYPLVAVFKNLVIGVFCFKPVSWWWTSEHFGNPSTVQLPSRSEWSSPPGPGERDVAGVGTPSLCSAHSGLLANTHQIDTPKGVCFPSDIHHSWHVCLLWALTGFEMVKFQISF